MDRENYILHMEQVLLDLQDILDSITAQLRENVEYGDFVGVFDALRRYREFSVRFVNADCDLLLVKLSHAARNRN